MPVEIEGRPWVRCWMLVGDELARSVCALVVMLDGAGLLLHGEERVRDRPAGGKGRERGGSVVVEVGVSIGVGVEGGRGGGKVELVHCVEEAERVGCGETRAVKDAWSCG